MKKIKNKKNYYLKLIVLLRCPLHPAKSQCCHSCCCLTHQSAGTLPHLLILQSLKSQVLQQQAALQCRGYYHLTQNQRGRRNMSTLNIWEFKVRQIPGAVPVVENAEPERVDVELSGPIRHLCP